MKRNDQAEKINRWLGYEVTSGLGIGGAGKHDVNAETTELIARGEMRMVEQDNTSAYVYPNGGTQGIRTPGKRCEQCGKSANWNSGAGQYLCSMHWDEY